jgi:hypothetical protein
MASASMPRRSASLTAATRVGPSGSCVGKLSSERCPPSREKTEKVMRFPGWLVVWARDHLRGEKRVDGKVQKLATPGRENRVTTTKSREGPSAPPSARTSASRRRAGPAWRTVSPPGRPSARRRGAARRCPSRRRPRATSRRADVNPLRWRSSASSQVLAG